MRDKVKGAGAAAGGRRGSPRTRVAGARWASRSRLARHHTRPGTAQARSRQFESACSGRSRQPAALRFVIAASFQHPVFLAMRGTPKVGVQATTRPDATALCSDGHRATPVNHRVLSRGLRVPAAPPFPLRCDWRAGPVIAGADGLLSRASDGVGGAAWARVAAGGGSPPRRSGQPTELPLVGERHVFSCEAASEVGAAQQKHGRTSKHIAHVRENTIRLGLCCLHKAGSRQITSKPFEYRTRKPSDV